MTQVASIPEAPPLTNGFTVPHTPEGAAVFGFASAIPSDGLMNDDHYDGRSRR